MTARNRAGRAGALSLALALGGCTGWDMAKVGSVDSRALACKAAQSAEPIPLRHSVASAMVTVSFDELKGRINERCQTCHLQTSTGGFQYVDGYGDQNGRPGLASAAERMAAALQARIMPPSDPNPEGSLLLGQVMEAWIKAGKLEGPFSAPAALPSGTGGRGPQLGPDVAETLTNIGTCIPDPAHAVDFVEPNRALDRFFAAATELPKDLADTDLRSFDAAELTASGVFAYAPAYPLWSDDARKLRMVRVPGHQKITYHADTKALDIPPNSRFYKTFFKQVVEPDGHLGNRAIETRLIVSRPAINGVDQSLFGTYLWDETGTQATLWDGAYRDGTPFRDKVFTYTDSFDNCKRGANGAVLTNADGSPMCDAHQRTYAVPARHRCIQCHQGAEGQNFVLGFTPLQINRRPHGEGGVIGAVSDDELSQVERLVAYGVLDGVDSTASLPRLESSGGDRTPRNGYELQAQAYMIGNCAHCHNPRGFPVRDEPRLRDFNLAAGGIMFQFPLGKQSISTPTANYVNPMQLDLASNQASLIYRRAATPVTTVWSDANGSSHLVVPHMPANTPGMDCRAPDIFGRWIASIAADPTNGAGLPLPDDATPAQVGAAQAAADKRVANFAPNCLPPPDIANWVTEDLTEPTVYVPRRSDFNSWTHAEDDIDPFVHPELIHGMPAVFRNLQVDDAVAQVADTQVPYGFWAWKKSCNFPADLPPNPGNTADHNYYRRPWMLTTSGQPRRPLGEVFFETPGAAIFRAVCSNCHGASADGNSGNAKALLQLSGGSIRVANLMQGLFGPQSDPGRAPGTNLALFDQPGPNGLSIGPFGAAKYIVWMTSGGTNVKFPDGFETLLGTSDKKFGGNMMTKVSYYCSRLLPSQFWVGDLANDEFQNGIPDEKRELWNLFCGFRNQAIPDPNNIPAGFDGDQWVRTAKTNGGLMMFFFFRDQALHGGLPPNADQCERSSAGPK